MEDTARGPVVTDLRNWLVIPKLESPGVLQELRGEFVTAENEIEAKEVSQFAGYKEVAVVRVVVERTK